VGNEWNSKRGKKIRGERKKFFDCLGKKVASLWVGPWCGAFRNLILPKDTKEGALKTHWKRVWGSVKKSSKGGSTLGARVKKRKK